MSKPAPPKATGQKNLFSFFSKKSKDESAARIKAKKDQIEKDVAAVTPNTRLAIYWPADKEFYPCVVKERFSDGRFSLLYDDGDKEVVDLRDEVWKRIDERKDRDDDGVNHEKEDTESGADEKHASKRRRILESDESYAMDDDADDDDDDDSFKIDNVEDDDDDDDVDEPPPPRAKPVAKPTVTVVSSKKRLSPTPRVSPTPRKSSRPTPPKPIPFAAGAITPPASPTAPDTPIPNEVNPPGTHLHNHLKFFTTHRVDAHNRPSSHPSHSPFTLSVDTAELEARCRQFGNNLTPAQKQWWEIKASHADCVLLFKTGKFYEMFHDDADVAAKELGMAYMKGVVAHAGFPEAAYDKFLGMLVERGYRVARVEQTESPEGLKERKKETRGKKPQVVAREVCGVVSRGTRTYCYLEDASCFENDNKMTTGPLIVIKEILLEENDSNTMDVDEEDSGTHAVCEYGVTIVDAVTASVSLGQFADDVLRSRMQTLLASFAPLEVILEGGENGASKTLHSLIKSACPTALVGRINPKERFPQSTAIDPEVRRTLNRTNQDVQPWNPDEALQEVHRKGYYPRSSRKNEPLNGGGIARWPDVLRACIEGEASLALSSFGAALFYLQRSLIDADILSMGIVKAYIPPSSGCSASARTITSTNAEVSETPDQLQEIYNREAGRIRGVDLMDTYDSSSTAEEASIDCMVLDGTTLNNLEILHNMSSGSHQGSLLSKIDFTRSPHGCRLLRAWLLRPLFRKAEIDRRADAVAELSTGSLAMAMSDARSLLKKTGDIERLLSRVHSMGGGGRGEGSAHHPDERAIYYDNEKHNKRKVGDFSKLLHGLKAAAGIPELFENMTIQSPLLMKIVRTTDDGGCFPSGLNEKLDWFFENFDLKKAAKGQFEPAPGMSEDYDHACETIENIQRELEAFKHEMCNFLGHGARSSWKYINTKEDAKEKYLIELPSSVPVPNEFEVKGKRGKGQNQVNKYRTPVVERLVEELERAIDIKNEGKAMGMKLVFAKFDSQRDVWMAANHATAMLDAIGSLAELASQPGYCRPCILECPSNRRPGMKIIKGRHPCVDVTHSGGMFIPNDLILGGISSSTDDEDLEANSDASVLLLSGPNMGGKSTLLRQTCLITILAQVGSFVPAEECTLTPVDRIFTRLGASDRILCGQSTFFVELAETAAAVRGATRRSLVIMDELGRGTSTFDGTAIASATVKHLVERSKCLTLFATHYHSLLEDWKHDQSVRLGHMECIVEDDSSDDANEKSNITFLYTLGEGPCPKSFGVNVARLACLPEDVIRRAKNVSAEFEAEMNGESKRHKKIIPSTAKSIVRDVMNSFSGDCITSLDEFKDLWRSLQ